MRLSNFIRTNSSRIIQDWQDHARNVDETKTLNLDELQDHLRELLPIIADDLASAQTIAEEVSKSTGQSVSPGPYSAALNRVSRMHSLGRFHCGFSIEAMVSEYRALRASVLRLWAQSYEVPRCTELGDILRFNEAIDQSIVTAVACYAEEKGQRVRLLDTILSSGPDHAYIFDLDGRLMYANKALAERFNMSQDEMVGKNLYDLDVPKADEVHQQIAHVIKTGEPLRAEVGDEAGSRKFAYYEYILTPVFNRRGQVEAVAGTGRNITERKILDDEIWHKANYDALTALPNRRLFRDRLEQEVRHAERTGIPIALLFIDLDNFKEANDALGHDAGDMLLRQAADRIRSCVREADTVARLGGDEFTVILTNIDDADHVHGVAQKILQVLADPFLIQQNAVNISGSIGIAVCAEDGARPEQLIRNADQAMYAAKNAGRNGYRFFAPEMEESVRARFKLISELRLALQRRQLVMHYQPIVDLTDGRIHKAEALLRWLHPQHGMLPPKEFIGLAEEAGLIDEIGNWVLREAAVHAQQWAMLRNVPFQISVNQSALQFMATLERVNWESFLKRLRLPSNSLSLEISEDVFLTARDAKGEKFSNLRAAGIELAIHHFGTGYAPIRYLNRFDVDYLKIDQSFVHQMLTDESSRAIAETIVVMAHKLGIKAVAEGVETREQKDCLSQAGCDYAQGFLFSKPVPAEQFTELLITR